MSQQSPLKFRMAVRSDMDGLIALAQASHEESRFRYIPFNQGKVGKIVLKALEDEKRHAIMVALKNDNIIGATYCSVGEYHIGTGVLLTTIHGIGVIKPQRTSLSGGKAALGLFKGIETWSKARGVKEILFHVTSGVELASAHKLAKRIGYKFVGGSYAKVV